MILFFLICTVDQSIRTADSLFAVDQYNIAESIYINVLNSAEKEKVAYAYKGLGNIRLNYGEIDSAFHFYNQALKTFKDLDDLSGQIKIFNNLSAAAIIEG